jgi:hypothetical protein
LEHFEILEQVKQWSRIKLQYDSYEGWVDSKQYQILSEANFIQLSNDAIILSADLIEYITEMAIYYYLFRFSLYLF